MKTGKHVPGRGCAYGACPMACRPVPMPPDENDGGHNAHPPQDPASPSRIAATAQPNAMYTRPCCGSCLWP
eukprot:3591967-Lingulodinium_polyedra.AAC.1